MPVFWADKARAYLGEERYAAASRDPLSEALLTWNVFQTLETHYDQDWLAYRLQMFGGTGITAPVRLQLWTGKDAEPLLQPSRGYVQTVRERALEAGASEEDIAAFRNPIEVDVRIESPDVLCLIHTLTGHVERGFDGRDRILELIDAGLEHARRLSKTLAVAALYQAGTDAATDVSNRINELRTSLAEELPHQPKAGSVELRDVSWQKLLRVWESELPYLDIPGSPKPFLQHVKANGLY